MRLAVYTDYVYRRAGGTVYADRAFALFLASLASDVERLVLLGRLSPDEGAGRYRLPDSLTLVPMPHYESLANPVAALWSLARATGAMWRALRDVDVLWALGPYPHALALALLGWMRRRTVVLGVRQDWPRYVRTRRPGRRGLHIAADAMEWAWRALARRFPIVVVGSDLAAKYARSAAVLQLSISLVPAAAVASKPPPRDFGSELTALSVGRLDEEKNPLLMPEIMALLGERWRLRVAGEGDLAGALAERARELGVDRRVEQLGYVPMGGALMDLYRSSHALLHVSWTEGFPQVLVEAFASGLPVVATAVGGVAVGVGDAALLIAPGDPSAAARALQRLAEDEALRQRLVAAGLRRARELTREAQTQRLLAFLRQADRRPVRA